MSEPVATVTSGTFRDGVEKPTSVYLDRIVPIGTKLYDESALREARIEGMRMAMAVSQDIVDFFCGEPEHALHKREQETARNTVEKIQHLIDEEAK